MAGCQRLPKNVQRVTREKEGGKTNIVCVYLRGEVANKREPFFLNELPPLLALLYIALLYTPVLKMPQP